MAELALLKQVEVFFFFFFSPVLAIYFSSVPVGELWSSDKRIPCEWKKQDSLSRMQSVLQPVSHLRYVGFKTQANLTGSPSNTILRALFCWSVSNRGPTLIPEIFFYLVDSICTFHQEEFVSETNLVLVLANTSGNLRWCWITAEIFWAKLNHLENSGLKRFLF